jgi:hypothetical protein
MHRKEKTSASMYASWAARYIRKEVMQKCLQSDREIACCNPPLPTQFLTSFSGSEFIFKGLCLHVTLKKTEKETEEEGGRERESSLPLTGTGP